MLGPRLRLGLLSIAFILAPWACGSEGPAPGTSSTTGAGHSAGSGGMTGTIDTGDAGSGLAGAGGTGGATSTGSASATGGASSTGGAGSTGSGAGGGGEAGASMGDPEVAELALGDRHTCARMTTGSLHCWGLDNLAGSLGAGPGIVTSPTPRQVLALTGTGYLAGVKQAAAGYDHTCAILSSGELVCFGGNVSGQLGNGTVTSSSLPVFVKGVNGAGHLSGVVQVACGAYHTCALTSTGVYCWGQGPLGDGTSLSSPVPVQVLDPSGADPFMNAAQIGVGEDHTCIRSAGGALHCFGDNSHGQLGDGSTATALLPTRVKNVAGQAGFLAGVEEIEALGYWHSCVRVAGTVLCWGGNDLGQIGADVSGKCLQYVCTKLPVAVQGLGAPAVEIAVGESHACARLSDGRVMCWGSNLEGQLAADVTTPCQSGSHPCTMSPGTVMTATGTPLEVSRIASGSGDHTCAIATDGAVWCWGKNTFGQLGDGTKMPSPHPVEVMGL